MLLSEQFQNALGQKDVTSPPSKADQGDEESDISNEIRKLEVELQTRPAQYLTS